MSDLTKGPKAGKGGAVSPLQELPSASEGVEPPSSPGEQWLLLAEAALAKAGTLALPHRSGYCRLLDRRHRGDIRPRTFAGILRFG